ncbi:hypothetical protein ACQ4WX_47790 [Streptomyces lasalocidi]
MDAGETYGNSEILLLLRRGLSDDEIRNLARERTAEIGSLQALLQQSQALTVEQKDLIAAKLQYAVEPMKGSAVTRCSSSRVARSMTPRTND